MIAWDRLQPKTPARRRQLALGLFALAVLLVIAAVAIPAWLLHQYYAENARLFTRQLTSYTNLNAKRPALMKAAEKLKTVDAQKYYLKATTPALANAELQDIAKAIIESGGGRVLSIQPYGQALKEDNGFKPTGITVAVSANVLALRKTLHALESREPYLFVDGLTIRTQVPPSHKGQPGVEPEMFVQIDLLAYTQGAAGSEKSDKSDKAKPAGPATKGSATAKGAA